MAVSGRKPEDFSPSMLLGSDVELEHYCVPCDEQGSRIEAYGYCVDCSEHLCETCYRLHTKPAPCRNHVLLDKSRMPKWQSLLGCSGDIPTHCSKHKEKIIEYNCKDHDTLDCNVCVAMEHRSCKVDYIPDVSKGYSTSTEYQSRQESMNALQASIDEVKFANSCHQQEIEDNRNKVKQDIKQYRKNVDEILNKWEEKTLKEADSIFDGFFATSKTVEEQCDKLLEDLYRLQDMFKSVDKQEHLLYVCVKKYTTQISEQQQKFAELDTDYFHPELFVFQPNTQLQTIVQSDLIFGKLTKRSRAEQILAKRKEVKETERELNVCLEKESQRGFGTLVLHTLLPTSNLNRLHMHTLLATLKTIKTELRRLEEAEQQGQSLN